MKKFSTIVILAAGQSLRFWPLTDKNLFQFFDKSLVCHRVARLQSFADKIVIVASPSNATAIESDLVHLSNTSIVVQNNPGFANAFLSVKKKGYLRRFVYQLC